VGNCFCKREQISVARCEFSWCRTELGELGQIVVGTINQIAADSDD